MYYYFFFSFGNGKNADAGERGNIYGSPTARHVDSQFWVQYFLESKRL